VTGDVSMIRQVVFNDILEEKIPLFASQLSHTAASVFATPSYYEPWANNVPCAYIYCTEDNAIPLPIQQQMASQLGPHASTSSVKAGHCPHLSIPDELAKVIEQTIDAGLGKKNVSVRA
jgi:pimeloyl-ACP methyl ester carboxylesterase